MSVVEQWGEFGDQLNHANAGMESRHEDYKGFTLKATVSAIEHGFLMQICVSPPRTSAIKEIIQTPPWSPTRFSQSQEALEALFAYGRAMIDGNMPAGDD